MGTLNELLAKSHRSTEKESAKKENGRKEHRKESKETREKREERQEEKKNKFKYPEMKLDEVKNKIDSGYTFKAATDNDYKDKAVEKLICTIKLPKMGYTPFVAKPPVGSDEAKTNEVTKPMDVVGDPAKKDENKVESAFEPNELKKHFLKLSEHHFKAMHTGSKEDKEAFHKHAKELHSKLDASEKETPSRKAFHQNMKNAVRAMESLVNTASTPKENRTSGRSYKP